MRKIIIAFLFIVTVGIFFCGCNVRNNSGYTPNPTSNYFETGDVYRVIGLDGEPETIEKFGLESFIFPSENQLFGNISVTEPDWTFAENSLFVRNPSIINKDGIKLIYNCIEVLNYIELNNSPSSCSATNLYTYNNKIAISKSLPYEMDLSEYPNFTVVGYVADVKVYKFRYSDLSKKDGSLIKEGSFEAILCGLPYVGTFLAR